MTKWQARPKVCHPKSAKNGLAHLLIYRGTNPNISKFYSYERKTLIGPRADSAESRGGEDRRRLIIPDTAKEKPLAGKVVAVGPGTQEVKMEVAVGDQVLYGKYAGQELQIDGETYLIMKQNDILAII